MGKVYSMNKSRLEAFSDGVIAIIITIMVLGMSIPEGANWVSLKPVLPVFLTYVLSFIMVGIYWNNHHHLFQAVQKINGKILWANLSLLFWLSLVPFATGWMGNNHFQQVPVALYGFILFMASLAYAVLVYFITHEKNTNRKVADAIRSDRKGKASAALYVLGIILSFYYPIISVGIYIIVGAIWFIPDRRIEKSY